MNENHSHQLMASNVLWFVGVMCVVCVHVVYGCACGVCVWCRCVCVLVCGGGVCACGWYVGGVGGWCRWVGVLVCVPPTS